MHFVSIGFMQLKPNTLELFQALAVSALFQSRIIPNCFPREVRRGRLLKPLKDIISFFTNKVIQQNDRHVIHCISTVSFEKETEIAFSVKDALLEEINEGGARPFGGSKAIQHIQSKKENLTLH